MSRPGFIKTGVSLNPACLITVQGLSVLLLETSLGLLRLYALCDSCLGRQFGMLIHGLTNEERGRALKVLLTAEGHRRVLEGKKRDGVALLRTLASKGRFPEAQSTLTALGVKKIPPPEPCYLCGGVLEMVDERAAKVVEALKGYRFRNFLIGVALPVAVVEREDEVRSRAKSRFGESIRGELSRLIGKRVGEALGKPVEHKAPDILVVLDPFTDRLEVNMNPLYLAGRYVKAGKGLPQSSRLCPNCRGGGCEECKGSGRRLEDSVESLLAAPVLNATGGVEAVLHTAVRESPDTLVLGEGRPFILEVKKPKDRQVDLEALTRTVNEANAGRLSVHELRFSGKEEVKRLKRSEKTEETYRALVQAAEEVPAEKLEALEQAFKGVEVRQGTLKGRSAGKQRYLYESQVKPEGPTSFEVTVRLQGGLDPRGLIAGKGRETNPNMAEFLGTELDITRLELINVEQEGF
ncbi:MAG: tRNA pseudouridine(54/55) synthase Pus10 [Candidatus Bathyarchaeia archaeon]